MSSNKRLAALVAALLVAAQPALATIALDGSAVVGSSSNSTIASAAKTTTGTSDVLIALISSASGSASVPTVSGVTGASLTWTLRKKLSGTAIDDGFSTTGTDCEVWSATTTSTVTSQAVTATVTNNTDGNIQVFAFSGVNTTTPWDANGSLPASQTSSTHALATPTISGISTTSTAPATLAMLCGFVGQGTTTFPITVPTGYTALANNNQTPNHAGSQSTYKINVSALSSATVAYGSQYTDFYYIFDALQPSGGAAATCGPRSLIGVGC